MRLTLGMSALVSEVLSGMALQPARPMGSPLNPIPTPFQSFFLKTTVSPSKGSPVCTDWLRFISP